MAINETKIQPTNTLPDPVTEWAQDVVDGKVVAGPHIRNAARRHLDDLVKGPARGLTWDLAAANRAINFFSETLCLAGGQFEGKPFILHPSQKFKTGSLFGWKRADGSRRFRRAYVEEAKGNGKSPWAAGTGHYCLVADGESRAEVYAAASDKDQAMVLFRDAVAMRDQSPALRARLTPSGGEGREWNLAYLKTSSFFRPISGEKRKSGSGPRPSCALCDEVHEHPDALTIEMLERGFKFRRQPLLIMTTNSGSDRNSVCWEEHVHAIRVAAGNEDLDGKLDEDITYLGEVVDDSTFAFVCGLDKNEDPLTNPACWPKANPLLDVTITSEYLAGVVAQARQLPGRMNNILRLHFCVWTDSETAWMARATLEQVLSTDVDPDELAGSDVYLGADLSGAQDLTAMGFVVPTGTVDLKRVDEKTGEEITVTLPTFDAWVEAWTPADTLHERALRDKAQYGLWAEQGWLHTTPGKTIRMDFVAARIAEINTEYRILALAYDRYSYDKLRTQLDDLGLTIKQIAHPQGGKIRAKVPDEDLQEAKRTGKEPPQGLWMPGSIKELETLIFEKRIRIRKSPVLVSAAMSAALEEDPIGNRWFSKRKATQRIDAIVALAMAIGAATSGLNVLPNGPSVYETPGYIV